MLCEIVATVRAKRERRKDARPGELLAAALDLFVEKGFAATRAEEVAKRAGVSKGTLFLYFTSKEELFKAVVRENISSRFSEWSAEMDSYEGTSAELLRYCMTTWWATVGATNASGISKLMMAEAGNFPDLAAFYQTEVVEPGNQLIARILQRGIDSGEFRPMDVKYGVYAVLAPLLYLILWKHSIAGQSPNDTVIPEEYIAFQADTLLFGMCAPVNTPPREISE
jgi:TetR/AcrR family transcriptional regulator